MSGNSTHRYRCIAFDAVGTLITPVPSAGEIYYQTARRFGSNLTDAEVARRFKQAFRNTELADAAAAAEVRLITSEDRERQRWRQIVSEVLDDISDTAACFDQLFTHFAKPGSWKCFDDVAELLDRLESSGYVLAIASNFDRRLHDVCHGFPVLRKIGVRVISSEVGFRKPGRKFFDALVAQAGCPASEVLMVGDDAANDFAGARQAGLGAVLINRHRQSQSNARNPDEIGSLSELVDRLLK
ncbi:MAG TPA: HAD-IA family hydrolase [Planctomycetaceae bacterium]|jgi:putative hydrolase of the HAD superfamily